VTAVTYRFYGGGTMGCDVHVHVEVKLCAKWEHYSVPAVLRDYALFTKMAGVRAHSDEIEPICLPRGLPLDISTVTKFCRDYAGTDGHSDSWLSAAEVAEVQEWYDNRKPPPFGYMLGRLIGGELPAGVSGIRVVFWFDN
jgi:hypothetical protein